MDYPRSIYNRLKRRLEKAARAGVRFGPIANGGAYEKARYGLGDCNRRRRRGARGRSADEEGGPRGPAGQLLREHLDLARLDAGRLSAELGPLHRLRDTRRRAYLPSSNGAPYNARWNNGVDSFIQKQSYGAKWLWSPNNLSQSVAGIKMSLPLPFLSGPFLSGWSIVGAWEWGFNPYYGFPASAQQAQVNQNGRALLLQGSGGDSSRTGQADNSQAFMGVSNKTYGTLTAGRVNTLSLDAINSYDPMGGSYAFSPLGFSGSFAGFGDTEAARANTAVKYRLDFPVYGENLRVAGLVQWGGYDQGNGTDGMYQGQVGGDFNLFGGAPYAGTLSLDAIGSYAKDAVNLSTFTGTCATFTTGPFAGQTGCTSGLPMF